MTDYQFTVEFLTRMGIEFKEDGSYIQAQFRPATYITFVFDEKGKYKCLL